MVGMRFLRLLVRCLPSRDIPQAAKFFAGACFPELHPIAKFVDEAQRLAEVPFAVRDVGRGFSLFFSSTQAPILLFCNFVVNPTCSKEFSCIYSLITGKKTEKRGLFCESSFFVLPSYKSTAKQLRQISK
jgi:hypothetical protein